MYHNITTPDSPERELQTRLCKPSSTPPKIKREVAEIAQYLISTDPTRQMKADIAMPPSGAEMVIQQSIPTSSSAAGSATNVLDDGNGSTLCSAISRINHDLTAGHLPPPASSRTRLDAATAHRLLSTVTPGNSSIMGLGIAFDDNLSPESSVKSIDPGSLHSRKEKLSPELVQNATQSNASLSARKESIGTALSPQNTYSGTLIAEPAAFGPRRWDSGVPGLGNTILGPRHPRTLSSASSTTTSYHNVPEHNDGTSFSAHITSLIDTSLAPPRARRLNRAIRTSNKRPANSPPSGRRSTAKAAKISIVQSIYAQTPAELHKQKEELVPQRFGPRCLGPVSEAEKREKATGLWKAEKEKLDKEVERAATLERAKLASEGTRPCIANQHSLKAIRHSFNTDTDGAVHVQAGCFSSEAQKIIEYAYGTNKKSVQPVSKQDENKGHKNSKPVRQRVRPEGRAMSPDHRGPSKESSQGPSAPATSNTYRKDHASPSTTQSRTCDPTISRPHASSAHASRLNFLTISFLNLLGTYTHLHSSCPTVRPLRLIHTSLSSLPPTARSLTAALKDAQELLKVLASHQVATLEGLEDNRGELEKVGLESVMKEAEKRVKETEGYVRKLGEWIVTCGCLGDEI